MSAVEREHAENAAGGLDGILAGASTGLVRRFIPGASGARMAVGLARNPTALGRRMVQVPRELARIAAGRSEVTAPGKDKRFADEAWHDNPALRRAMQAYLVLADSASRLVDDADLGWRDEERMRFIVDNLVAALSPSNNPVLSPAAWKATVDTGGLNLLRGARNLATDLASSPRVPTMVDMNAFHVGQTVGVTAGTVVLRDEMFELIQYQPTTARVRARPLLVVPPTINKYYVLDLAPGRSLAEHLVGQGQQVFMISWRNPDRRHADWDLDAYGAAVLRALDAVEKITATDATSLMGVCSGGIIAALTLAHLADAGQLTRIAAAVEVVTMLEQGRRSTGGALLDDNAAQSATSRSKAAGYLDGRSLAEVFAWMRPNDLIWSYWVNNYLQGRTPPAFDILYWNADTTRMSAGLHADFVQIAKDNSIVNHTVSMLGSPGDPRAVDVDAYVVAAETDHICPWRSCYATTQLLGGDVRFVLSSSGHIAALVNPVTNKRSTYRTGSPYPADPDAWLAASTQHDGSWWGDFTGWLAKRSGPTRKAPTALGGEGFEPVGPAPGQYVFDR